VVENLLTQYSIDAKANGRGYNQQIADATFPIGNAASVGRNEVNAHKSEHQPGSFVLAELLS